MWLMTLVIPSEVPSRAWFSIVTEQPEGFSSLVVSAIQAPTFHWVSGVACFLTVTSPIPHPSENWEQGKPCCTSQVGMRGLHFRPSALLWDWAVPEPILLLIYPLTGQPTQQGKLAWQLVCSCEGARGLNLTRKGNWPLPFWMLPQFLLLAGMAVARQDWLSPALCERKCSGISRQGRVQRVEWHRGKYFIQPRIRQLSLEVDVGFECMSLALPLSPLKHLLSIEWPLVNPIVWADPQAHYNEPGCLAQWWESYCRAQHPDMKRLQC